MRSEDSLKIINTKTVVKSHLSYLMAQHMMNITVITIAYSKDNNNNKLLYIHKYNVLAGVCLQLHHNDILI